jgi:hypothetical protein
MKPLQLDLPDAQLYMLARSCELAAFVSHVAHLGIPPLTANRKGGIVLSGWSFGNTFGIMLVDHASEGLLPEPLGAVIKSYVKTYIVYGMLSLIFAAIAVIDRSVRPTSHRDQSPTNVQRPVSRERCGRSRPD